LSKESLNDQKKDSEKKHLILECSKMNKNKNCLKVYLLKVCTKDWAIKVWTIKRCIPRKKILSKNGLVNCLLCIIYQMKVRAFKVTSVGAT
jgi:hypothetical protein